MVNIPALLNSQPVYGLTPECLATLSGFLSLDTQKPAQEALCHFDQIELLEPPASHSEPFIDPLAALTVLKGQQGLPLGQARTEAQAWVSRLIGTQPQLDWVHFFDFFEPNTPACLPARQFVRGLRESQIIGKAITDFLDEAIDEALARPLFRWPTVHAPALTLAQRPRMPPAEAMCEWLPAGTWVDVSTWGSLEGRADEANPYVQWRRQIAPVAARLAQALGQRVFHFADLHHELDDDVAHRLLVLHWCCTDQPRSPYVQHLLKVSGPPHVDALKAALTDPAHYQWPFQLDIGPECFVSHQL